MQSLPSIFRSTKGNVMMIVLITLAVIAGFGYVALELNKIMNQTTSITRAKAIMGSTEQKVREFANQTTSYKNCNSNVGASSCTLDTTKFNSFFGTPIDVAGANDSTGNKKGQVVVEVTRGYSQFYDPISKKFRATIKLKNAPFSLKDINLDETINLETIQQKNIDCVSINPSAPVFKGFDSNGKIICGNFSNCGPNQFIAGVDPNTLNAICRDLITSGCGGSQFMESFTWVGGTNLRIGCRDRVDPYKVPEWWNGGSVNPPSCNDAWTATANGTCVASCAVNSGVGVQNYTVTCNNNPCCLTTKPATTQPCNINCSLPVPEPTGIQTDGFAARPFTSNFIQTYVGFVISFSQPLTTYTTRKFKIYNETMGYAVPFSIKFTSNKKGIYLKPLGCDGGLCNSHVYSFTVQVGAVGNASGTNTQSARWVTKTDNI